MTHFWWKQGRYQGRRQGRNQDSRQEQIKWVEGGDKDLNKDEDSFGDKKGDKVEYKGGDKD